MGCFTSLSEAPGPPHLRVRDFRGLLGQAAALGWDEVVVLGDVLVGVVEAARARSRRRPRQWERGWGGRAETRPHSQQPRPAREAQGNLEALRPLRPVFLLPGSARPAGLGLAEEGLGLEALPGAGDAPGLEGLGQASQTSSGKWGGSGKENLDSKAPALGALGSECCKAILGATETS